MFEAYVQFVEYISFMRTMNALRNMKLVKKMKNGRLFEAAVKVDFDKSKHLSERSIKRRNTERERLISEERAKAAEEQRKKDEEEATRKAEELERKNRRIEREEKRRLKRQKEKRERELEQQKLEEEIKKEKRKLMIAKRKLESRRLLSELFLRIEDKNGEPNSPLEEPAKEEDLKAAQIDLEAKLRQTLLKEQEIRLRKRIEAKMLLRLGEFERKNCDEEESGHSSRENRKRKHEEAQS
ncbi:unnamed protein product [Toxocara canis]|uniref:Uncharacterized protein n=1 Tax=Toxocara canis TaxID=6265 RepID=A0A3P7GYL0_TOXCA|nr:unnamed protein product [Toxocara canis]